MILPDNGYCEETSKLYGQGTKYKAVWDRMTQINANAKLLRQAYDATGDTSSIELSDAHRTGAKGSRSDELLSSMLILLCTYLFPFSARLPRTPTDFLLETLLLGLGETARRVLLTTASEELRAMPS